MSAILKRATLRTSRLLDFASEKELVAQTGHRREEWPLIILKELTDNAIDAGEEAGIAPEVTIKVDESGISVADNGPGLPAETIKGVLDFSVRVSSRAAYVSPTRGGQGNALKTILAMPFVLHGEHGRVEVEARGFRHLIDFRVDWIRQEPKIEHHEEASDVRVGTVVRILWPDSPRSILTDAELRFLQIADDFAWLNPHTSITVDWFGKCTERQATEPGWVKWKPSDPTSPHWYTPDHLERLIAGYISDDADRGCDRTVRELVTEFRGLSGSAKQKAVLEMTGLSRAPVSQLVTDGKIDRKAVESILEAMQLHSKPVKPAMLGVIGCDHFQALSNVRAAKWTASITAA